MKTLILYATKYGAAAKIAERIADEIDGAVVHDLNQDGIPDLAGFDCIIVGSSVYAGMFRKEAKAFLSQNSDVLRQKKLGLFISGMSPDNENVFDVDSKQIAEATALLGGIFDPKKASFMERLVMKAVTKQPVYTNTIDDDKIKRFVEEILR